MHVRAGFALLLLPLAARADDLADRIQKVTNGPEYKHARWGVLIVDAAGKTIYERNPDTMCLPASVTKLYTCATALAELGADHKFITPVVRRGEVKNGVLAGDLILVASGDLTFGGRRDKSGQIQFTNIDHTYANSGLGTPKLTDTDPCAALDDLAKQIVARGIKEVTGEVLIDDRLFPKARSSGSGPDVVSPILVNDNVVDLLVTPTKTGEPATVTMRPNTAFLQMDADVRTANGPTRFTIESVGPNQFAVRGSIAQSTDPLVRMYPVDDPTLFARALFVESLRRAGVKVAASVHRPKPTELPARDAKLPKVAEYQSEPLSEVIRVTLKVSHNLYASTLPILVGLKHGNDSTDGGLRQQAKFLKSVGVEPGQVSFGGGAGGAPPDSVTPRATVELLRAMSQHKSAAAYFDGLPILGVDGTLAEAVSKDSPARGKARGKTGTLLWTDSQNDRMLLRCKALAGEIETAKGTKLYFAMFVNDVPGGVPAQQGKVLGRLCEIVHQYGP